MGDDGEYNETRHKNARQILDTNKSKFKDQDKHFDELIGITAGMKDQ